MWHTIHRGYTERMHYSQPLKGGLISCKITRMLCHITDQYWMNEPLHLLDNLTQDSHRNSVDNINKYSVLNKTNSGLSSEIADFICSLLETFL